MRVVYYVVSIVWLDIAAIGALLLFALGVRWVSSKFGPDD